MNHQDQNQQKEGDEEIETRKETGAVIQGQVGVEAEAVLIDVEVGAVIEVKGIEIDRHMSNNNTAKPFILLKFKHVYFALFSDVREREYERTDNWRAVAPNSTIMVSNLPLHIAETEVCDLLLLVFSPSFNLYNSCFVRFEQTS